MCAMGLSVTKYGLPHVKKDGLEILTKHHSSQGRLKREWDCGYHLVSVWFCKTTVFFFISTYNV